MAIQSLEQHQIGLNLLDILPHHHLAQIDAALINPGERYLPANHRRLEFVTDQCADAVFKVQKHASNSNGIYNGAIGHYICLYIGWRHCLGGIQSNWLLTPLFLEIL